jgi:bacterioferritin
MWLPFIGGIFLNVPMPFQCKAKVNLPYPNAQAESQNPEYAREMLSNMGSRVSEMSAVSLYFYNRIILEPEYEEFSKCFEQISIVEMHHLKIFGELALQLGSDPRLWSISRRKRAYWTPANNSYPREIREVISNSLESEKDAIHKYSDQADRIRDRNIVQVLNRIILDEQRHVEIFNEMLERV